MTNPAYHKRRWWIPTFRTTTIIPFLFISTLIIAFWMIMDESTSPDIPAVASHLVYTTVPGFFAQDDPSTDDKAFDFMKENFGLIEQTYDTDKDLPAGASQWERFTHKLATLNSLPPASTSYRQLFLGRHGQGFHNVAESHFGTKAWDCYYSKLNGTANITWADAHLTPLGVKQAEDVAKFWRSQIATGMKGLESWYVSPLDRAMRTAKITFEGLTERKFKPVVKENLREAIGIHTCDRRSSRSYITYTYPEYLIEPNFSEEDPLWLPDLREPGSAQTIRLRGLLDDVFSSDDSTWISMTSHGGTIQSILRAVGHREFNVKTGGAIPVLVRVERREGHRPEEKAGLWLPTPECEGGDPEVEEVRDSLRRLDEGMN